MFSPLRFGGNLTAAGLGRSTSTSAWFSTGLVLVMVLLRGVARRTWAADVLFVAILTLPALSNPTSIPGALLTCVAVVWIIRRFGLLAMVSMGCASSLVQSMPLAGAGWYATLAIATPVLVAALAAWSLHVIVTSRPGGSSRPVSAAQFEATVDTCTSARVLGLTPRVPLRH